MPIDLIDYAAITLSAMTAGALWTAPHAPSRRAVRAVGRRCWPTLRPIVGWFCIIIGILGMILPGPGVPFFLAGVVLVGRRHPLLRRGIVFVKLRLRAWATRRGLVGLLGRRGRMGLRMLENQIDGLQNRLERRNRSTDGEYS